MCIYYTKQTNETIFYFSLHDRRENFKPRFQSEDLIRTAEIRRIFSKGDLTNWSHELDTLDKIIHDTIPSYR